MTFGYRGLVAQIYSELMTFGYCELVAQVYSEPLTFHYHELVAWIGDGFWLPWIGGPDIQ